MPQVPKIVQFTYQEKKKKKKKNISTFFKELGQWTKFKSGDPRSFHFLIQRAALAIQWGNTAAVLGTLPV